VALFTGDIARVRDLYAQALALYRALGDARGVADMLTALAWQAFHAGDHARAQHVGEEALALLRPLGDDGKTADALWSLGITLQTRGEWARDGPA